MDALLIAIMTWISAVSGLPNTDVLPAVEFRTAEEIHYMDFPDIPYDPDSNLPQTIASYVSGTIYLREGWTPTDPVELGILVHETTHHLQFVAATSYRCRAEQEKVAYDAQVAFLESMGIDPFDETISGMNELFYRIITSCEMMGYNP